MQGSSGLERFTGRRSHTERRSHRIAGYSAWAAPNMSSASRGGQPRRWAVHGARPAGLAAAAAASARCAASAHARREPAGAVAAARRRRACAAALGACQQRAAAAAPHLPERLLGLEIRVVGGDKSAVGATARERHAPPCGAADAAADARPCSIGHALPTQCCIKHAGRHGAGGGGRRGPPHL